SKALGSTRYAVQFRKPNPYDSVLAHIEPGTDEFQFEKEAYEIKHRLSAMLHGQPPPLANGFIGTSPLAARYRAVAEGVSEAEFASGGDFGSTLNQWIQSLGRIRRAHFFVLPD